MVDTLYRIPYPNPRCPHLLTCADDDHCLVVHQIASRHFLCIDVRTRAETRVDLPFQDLLNLGFCSTTHSFYLTTRKSKSVHFFLVHGQEMQIVDEIHLLGDHEIFLNVHIDGDSLRYLYLSSKIVMLGCFHLVSRTRQPAFSFDNRLYDVDHKSPFRLIDFVVDRSSIAFLIQLKKNDKYMIRICNLDRMDALHSFDLVDAGKPSSITCTNTSVDLHFSVRRFIRLSLQTIRVELAVVIRHRFAQSSDPLLHVRRIPRSNSNQCVRRLSARRWKSFVSGQQRHSSVESPENHLQRIKERRHTMLLQRHLSDDSQRFPSVDS